MIINPPQFSLIPQNMITLQNDASTLSEGFVITHKFEEDL